MTLYTHEDVISFIRDQLVLAKSIQYGDEAVSEYEHALQCATLAEQSEADYELIVAALLHDFGRVIMDDEQLSDSSEADPNLASDAKDHGVAGAEALEQYFSQRVLDCIRFHGDSKRYLSTKDQAYYDALSPVSKKTFVLQGGLMTDEECTEFEAMPYFKEMITVRRWDDGAKIPGMRTPPIDHWMDILRQVISM